MFKDNLKEIRLKHDMSQEDLAQVMSVTRQSISKYEKGTAEPSFEKLAILVDYFNVSYDDILGDTKASLGQASPPSQQLSRKDSRAFQTDQAQFVIIQSKIDQDITEAFYDFEVVEKYPYADYKPGALLIGLQPHSFFKNVKKDLAWYRTVEEANREVEAIRQAMVKGKIYYQLHYDVKVKKRGFFSVQYDETNGIEEE